MPRKPLVALVGRPNVGKSTLFNRLVGERRAIVEDSPGTTRDRHYADAEWEGRVFTLIDTGGLVLTQSDQITEQVRAQAQEAIAEADVIVFLGDITSGVVGDDYQMADLLRRTEKPILLVVNKVDKGVIYGYISTPKNVTHQMAARSGGRSRRWVVIVDRDSVQTGVGNS